MKKLVGLLALPVLLGGCSLLGSERSSVVGSIEWVGPSMAPEPSPRREVTWYPLAEDGYAIVCIVGVVDPDSVSTDDDFGGCVARAKALVDDWRSEHPGTTVLTVELGRTFSPTVCYSGVMGDPKLAECTLIRDEEYSGLLEDPPAP